MEDQKDQDWIDSQREIGGRNFEEWAPRSECENQFQEEGWDAACFGFRMAEEQNMMADEKWDSIVEEE